MADLADEESVQIKGSGSSVYTLKNSGGVYSCTCPAWMHQSIGIERRSCKHLRAYRGEAEEAARVGNPAPIAKAPSAAGDDEGPPVLLAHKWETDVDVTSWWLSEKLDGVRAYWDGKQFLSRLGNRFYPPDFFVEGFPDHPLDGELFGGRKLFQRTVGIVKRQDQSPLWKELSFVVFDAPAHPGPFEARMAHLQQAIGPHMPYARVHAHYRCEGLSHLKSELEKVEALGGEGLMARKPASLYEAGRSSTLLKIKSFKDAEARVVDHAAGAGKNKGRLGALVVELADGTRFNVGTGFTDAERDDPPPLGSIITFRYQELSEGGVPRFPSYVGVRIDAKEPSTLIVERPATEQPAPDRTLGSVVLVPKRQVRRFEKEENGVCHFWEVELVGNAHRITSGTFEEDTEGFESDEAARQALEVSIARQIALGFAETGKAPVSVPVASASVPPVSVPVASVASVASGASVAPTPVTAPAAPQGLKPARYFELVEGGSSKFWEIRLEGAAVSTRYGRIGTSGQSTTKGYPTEAQAKAEHDKLVLEKTKKGYLER